MDSRSREAAKGCINDLNMKTEELKQCDLRRGIYFITLSMM
jgi:hypothetical protein